MQNVIDNVLATIIFGALSTGLDLLLQHFGMQGQGAFNISAFTLCGFVLLFLLIKKYYRSMERHLTERLLKKYLLTKSEDNDTLVFRNRIADLLGKANFNADYQQANSIVEFSNQQACELLIRKACLKARNIKILTIRGEKYFAGSRSLLHDICLEKKGNGFKIQILVQSPSAGRITKELADSLGHNSSDRTKRKMRNTLGYLIGLTNENANIEVKCYNETPIFKFLIFDDEMFVSCIIGPKNDQNAKMWQLIRLDNALFTGFERFFDELLLHSVEPDTL